MEAEIELCRSATTRLLESESFPQSVIVHMCERRNLRHTALYLVPFTAARLGNHAAVGDLAIVLSTRQFNRLVAEIVRIG